MSEVVVVRVPASTSNLGAGFDCAGAAVDLWLTATVQLDSESTTANIAHEGTLAGLRVTTEKNRLLMGFRAACDARGVAAPAFRAALRSDIPVGRGLGSSAAATVAGAAAANALLSLRLDNDALLETCSSIEGHADNVAPAIFGGACLVFHAERTFAAPLPIHPSLALVFAIPDFAVETAEARRILPSQVAHAAATRAVACAGALVLGLQTADRALLTVGLDDVLHVPFRESLVPGLAPVIEAARTAGAVGATLSGSGSSIVAVATRDRATRVGAAMCRAWDAVGVHAAALVNPPHVGGYSSDIPHRAEERTVTYGGSLCR